MISVSIDLSSKILEMAGREGPRRSGVSLRRTERDDFAGRESHIFRLIQKCRNVELFSRNRGAIPYGRNYSCRRRLPPSTLKVSLALPVTGDVHGEMRS